VRTRETMLLRAQSLIELMRMANNGAEFDTRHREGWTCNHAEEFNAMAEKLERLLTEIDNLEVTP
jgi:hypothetical protein